jgi:hypothetical protein
MNAPRREVNPLDPPSLDALEQAFRGLVDNLIEHRQRREALVDSARTFKFMSYAEIANTNNSVLRALDIVEDPVSFALKRGIKSLGQVIYDIYGWTRCLIWPSACVKRLPVVSVLV